MERRCGASAPVERVPPRCTRPDGRGHGVLGGSRRQAVTNGEPTYMPAQPQQALGGDWRQAANNIGDDFDVDMDWRAPPL